MDHGPLEQRQLFSFSLAADSAHSRGWTVAQASHLRRCWHCPAQPKDARPRTPHITVQHWRGTGASRFNLAQSLLFNRLSTALLLQFK